MELCECQQVVAVDNSASMLSVAEQRLRHLNNVDLRRGQLTELPVDDKSIDVASMVLVVPYVAEPEVAIREAARALRPRGKLIVVEMLAHDRQEYQQEMGHLWLGFEEESLRTWLRLAGLSDIHWTSIPPDPAAKGPALFSITGVKAA